MGPTVLHPLQLGLPVARIPRASRSPTVRQLHGYWAVVPFSFFGGPCPAWTLVSSESWWPHDCLAHCYSPALLGAGGQGSQVATLAVCPHLVKSSHQA